MAINGESKIESSCYGMIEKSQRPHLRKKKREEKVGTDETV